MATQTTIHFVDDLNGDAADETVEFALDGKNYEIDLTSKNAEKLRDALAEFIAASRKAQPKGQTHRPTRRTPQRSSETPKIRAWAQANGYEVSDRGRIPKVVRDAYRIAQDGAATPATEGTEPTTQGHTRDECDNLDECTVHAIDSSPATIKAWWVEQGNTEPKSVTPTIRKKYLAAHNAA